MTALIWTVNVECATSTIHWQCVALPLQRSVASSVPSALHAPLFFFGLRSLTGLAV